MTERVSVSDLVGIWQHPEGTPPSPCTCCGVCACKFHGGEWHNNRQWCSICVGRGHHEEAQ